MRAVLFGIALALGLAIAIPAPAIGAGCCHRPRSPLIPRAAWQLLISSPEGKDPKADINANRGGGGRWYANPIWMAIGGLAVPGSVLIVMAVRGGGTTIVKE